MFLYYVGLCTWYLVWRAYVLYRFGVELQSQHSLSFFPQIIEVLNALETFSVLSESKIEGIDAIAHRFKSLYAALKKKPYDPLDHRRPEFNTDFTEFQRQIDELEVRTGSWTDLLKAPFQKNTPLHPLDFLGKSGRWFNRWKSFLKYHHV